MPGEFIECGTKLPPNYMNVRNRVASVNNMVSVLHHDLCVNKMFSVVFYVIANENGQNNVPPSFINTCINNLNNAFKRICITFTACSTVVIPNHTWNHWTQDTIEGPATASYYTQNTINIYLPDSILGSPSGYALMPGAADVIVLEKGVLMGITPIHEMGHFFGLPHTFDEIGGSAIPAPPPGATSSEFVRRDNLANCYFNGDGFCDTDADCYPLNKLPGALCSQEWGAKDGFNEYYTPPVDNYMSYYTCRCRFTQEQLNFMANVALTQRFYLH